MKRIQWALILTLLAAPLFGQRIVADPDDPDTAPDRGVRREAIRASILLQSTGRTREADPRDTFFDGQRFRLRVSTDRDGYLYAFCLNSQGSAVMLYPNRYSDPENRMDSAPRLIPDSGWFQFDQETGTERVYLILAERPLPDLERAAQRGGEVSQRTLDRYMRSATGGDKGIGVARDDAAEYVVRKLNLRHEARE